MTPNEIKKVLKAARDLGVRRMRFEGIEAEFFRTQVSEGQSNRPRGKSASATPVSQIPVDEDPEANLSFEEMLNWSSPAYDLLQQRKQADKETPVN